MGSCWYDLVVKSMCCNSWFGWLSRCDVVDHVAAVAVDVPLNWFTCAMGDATVAFPLPHVASSVTSTFDEIVDVCDIADLVDLFELFTTAGTTTGANKLPNCC